MPPKRHTCTLGPSIIREIEYIIPKLKYSVYIQQIKSWLENFEQGDAILALDFLFYLEYISSAELQLRIDEQLMRLDDHFGFRTRYLLIPFAEYPKSNDVVMYLISKCPYFKILNTSKRIHITSDIEKVDFSKHDVLVFVDDFIGTGKSFASWYKESKINNILGTHSNLREQQAVLATICMEDAGQFLLHKFPDIKIFAEIRTRIFCTKHSPFNLTDDRMTLKAICLKYGTAISKTPLGFGKSEALIAFDYGTPNNCLPIIWAEQEWEPIFPRFGASRIKKASEIKNEAAFFIGLINKLKISFDKDLKVKVNGQLVELNTREDHSVLVYLLLKEKQSTNLSMCQVLGITLSELDKIVTKAHAKQLVDPNGELSIKGLGLLKHLKKMSAIFKFRQNDNLNIKDKKVFVPKTFRKKT
jgi:hypothetical protein